MPDKQEQRKLERETEAYNLFKSVARKVKVIDYDKKWVIEPDLDDPLRKIMLSRDIGLCKLSLRIKLKDTYHRGDYNYDTTRYDWYGMIAVTGLYREKQQNHYSSSGKKQDTYEDVVTMLPMKVKPRMAKKLIKYVDEIIVPKFYAEIENEKDSRDKMNVQIQEFNNNIAKVKGLSKGSKRNSWEEPSAILKGCPLELTLERDRVNVGGSLTYIQLREMASKMGWGQ